MNDFRNLQPTNISLEKLTSESMKSVVVVNKHEIENELIRLKCFKEYWDELYGKGLEIANWHMNGGLEDFDNFYDLAMEEYDKEINENINQYIVSIRYGYDKYFEDEEHIVSGIHFIKSQVCYLELYENICNPAVGKPFIYKDGVEFQVEHDIVAGLPCFITVNTK